MVVKERRRVWIVADIRDAFLHVSVPRLLDVVRKLLPADDLIDFLRRLLAPGKPAGLRQGGPLSPLMLNVYLHHFLDRPWRRDHLRPPSGPLADDMLVACRTESQARTAFRDLHRLLLPTGMQIKETDDEAIHDLNARCSRQLAWLRDHQAARGLAIRIGERAWDRLTNSWRWHIRSPTRHFAPAKAIRGWLDQRGPCYDWSDRDEVYRRIVATASKHAFDEIP